MKEPFDLHRPYPVHRRCGTAGRRVDRATLRTAILAGVLIGVAVPVGRLWRPLAPVAGAGSDMVGAGSAEGSTVTRRFGSCFTGGGENCVVDGDTFRIDGQRVRIADIDTPETHPPRCAEEARLGAAATERLQALLNAGPVTLRAADRDTDRYGRLLRIVERDGVSLGQVLVDEGLARPWEGRRRPWCGAGA